MGKFSVAQNISLKNGGVCLCGKALRGKVGALWVKLTAGFPCNELCKRNRNLDSLFTHTEILDISLAKASILLQVK